MNTHPIEHAALAAAPSGPHAAAAQARETQVQSCAALMRQLADAMLSHVQNTASLNLTTARAVLMHARIPTPPNLQQRSDTWRQSWRIFEICATSADQVLNLTRGHVERTTGALWRTTERLLDDMAQVDGARVAALREAFDSARAAQAALWQATRQVHHELVALVQSPLVQSSLARDAEPAHGPH